MIDRWVQWQNFANGPQSDRVAGFLVAVIKILLISYGVRTEMERLRAWFDSFSKISQISHLCTNSSKWKSVKTK